MDEPAHIIHNLERATGSTYTTLCDHAFTVTGGSVTGARRLNPPSIVGWGITVEPDSNGDVTIVLPATRDCDAQGAICADGDKKLSSPPGLHRQRAGRIGRAPRAQRHRIRGCGKEGQALLPGPVSRQALEGRQMPWSYSGIVREEDGTWVAVREVNADNQAEAWRGIEDFCHRLSEVTGRKLEMDPGTFRCTGKAAGSGYAYTFFLTGG